MENKSFVSAIAFSLCGTFFLLGQLGCTKSNVDPALLAKYQEKYILTSEPPDVDTVYGVRETLLGANDSDHGEHDHDEHAEGNGHDHDAEGHAEHEDEAHEHEEHNQTDEHSHEHAKEVLESTAPQPVAMMGQIGGLANPWEETQPEFPFAKKQAIFFLADPQAIAEHEAEGHVHAPGEECAFCAAHAEENSELLALVRLVDEKGKVLPMDARELLNLKANDMVVVEGEAQVLEGGMMIVNATGVYVRK